MILIWTAIFAVVAVMAAAFDLEVVANVFALSAAITLVIAAFTLRGTRNG